MWEKCMDYAPAGEQNSQIRVKIRVKINRVIH